VCVEAVRLGVVEHGGQKRFGKMEAGCSFESTGVHSTRKQTASDVVVPVAGCCEYQPPIVSVGPAMQLVGE
jgi:hypothetical protein